MLRSLGLAVALVLGPLGAPSGAFIDSNLAVSPATHAIGGGCYPLGIAPGLLDQLNLLNPEWAPIDVVMHAPPESAPVTMHATVTFAKINEGGDNSGNHATDDQNTFLTLDSAEQGFVATGNVGPHGEEGGQLEFEWEIGSYPLFAWAGMGDRMTTVGRWIWDCGHPDPDPLGTCSTTMTQACILDTDCASPLCPGCLPGETCTGVVFNYHSELHPPQAVAVSRRGQGFAFSKLPRPGRAATRTDVWVSPDGGGAGDRCVVTHHANPADQLSVQCFPLSQPLADVNVSDFAFDIPLPPRPPGNTRPPRVRIYERTPARLPRAKVATTFVDGTPPLVHAVVRMTAMAHGKRPSRVGKSIVAGWRHDRLTPMTRLRVDVTAIDILNPLKPVTPPAAQKQRCSVTTAQDCSATPCPAGETCLTLGGPIAGWEAYLEVNGNWQKLAGLESVLTPTSVPQQLHFDLALPADGSVPLYLHVSGHSLGCREGQLYGTSFARAVGLYGFTDGQACLFDESHDIGAFGDPDFPVTHGAPDFGGGSHVTQSRGGAGGACSTTTSRLCLTTDDCPAGETCVVTGGSFRLHYTVTTR